MDSSTDNNIDPINGTASVSGATSFAADFDMSAINEAVAAGGDADKVPGAYNTNDISLDNTPTTDADLQAQLSDNPGMSLANSSDSTVTADPIAAATTPAPAEPQATFVSGDIVDEPEEETIADLANNADEENIAVDPLAVPSNDGVVLDALADGPNTNVAPASATPAATTTTATSEVKEDKTRVMPAPAPTAPKPKEDGKSKVVIYIIFALAVIAAAAVAIAAVVSNS